MTPVVAVLVLFVIAIAVALLARRLELPYTVALVLAGLLLGATGALSPPRLSAELLYGLILPALLFEAALHLGLERFWANGLAIQALALPGVLASMALTALGVLPFARHLGLPASFGVTHGLLLGAVLAATDPIAVVALFKSLHAPKRLAAILEGESLLNDGTAAVAFSLVLGALRGQPFHPLHSGLEFARIVGLGALTGFGLGYALSKLTARLEDPKLELTLTTIAAYGSFQLAERAHVSGAIATVVAGMTYGTYGVARGMSPSTRLTVHAFWDYLAFAMNSVVFLLVGFTVQLSLLRAHWRAVLLSFLVVAIARAATVYATTLALRRTRERMPWSWPALLSWGGLRGALSMVLVLGLPEDLPLREQLVAMTFGAVLLSIVLQGMTVAPLLRRLGLSREEAGPSEHEQLRAAQGSARAALAALARLEAEGAHDAAALEAAKKGYTEKLRDAQESAKSLPEEAHEPSKRELARALLLVEKDHLRRRHHEGQLSAQGLEAMEARLDEALLALEEE